MKMIVYICVEVVIVLVMGVLQEELITAIHVQTIIIITQDHVKLVIKPVLDVVQQELITVMHVQVIIMIHQELV